MHYILFAGGNWINGFGMAFSWSAGYGNTLQIY